MDRYFAEVNPSQQLEFFLLETSVRNTFKWIKTKEVLPLTSLSTKKIEPANFWRKVGHRGQYSYNLRLNVMTLQRFPQFFFNNSPITSRYIFILQDYLEIGK